MDDRPRFAKPPVGEVALAVYFSPPLPLQSVDVGILWRRLQNQYPHYVDQPVLPPVPPEARQQPPFTVNFQLGPSAGTRTVFRSRSGERVVQVQGDRVVLNWHRTADEPAYPGYDVLRPELLRVLEHVRLTCAELGGTPPRENQVEVHYVNPVAAGDGAPGEASRILEPWTGRTSTDFLRAEEELRLDVRYVITDAADQFRGRLYVSAAPAMVADPGRTPRPGHVLQLFARVGATPDTVSSDLDLAHQWVVNGFAAITTKPMHRVWQMVHEEER